MEIDNKTKESLDGFTHQFKEAPRGKNQAGILSNKLSESKTCNTCLQLTLSRNPKQHSYLQTLVFKN